MLKNIDFKNSVQIHMDDIIKRGKMKLNEISTIKMKSFEINTSNIVGETTRNNFNHEQLVLNNLINKDLLHF
jgi:hypothetical protein